jgi:D-3-phosphoglycerate dehydrogenase
LIFTRAGQQPTRDELQSLLPQCVGYLAGVEPITAELLAEARGLKVISRNGVGVDNIDGAAAKRLGIQVLPAAGANSQGVAELTLALMLALARHIPYSHQALVAGRWERTLGHELHGKRLGIVGCGQIGQRVARMACGFGMQVWGHDPWCSQVDASGIERLVECEELWSTSDVVTLHCPPPADDMPLVGEHALANVRPSLLLVNTARSALVDLNAVATALDNGRLGGYATDVFEQEPPAPHRLYRHPKVIVTPHIGGYTRESIDRAVVQAVDHLLQNLPKPKEISTC